MKVEEIRRRVDEILDTVLIEIEALPEAERPKNVRQLAAIISREIDGDTAAGLFREGLVRIVRRLMRLRNRRKNVPKKTKKSGSNHV